MYTICGAITCLITHKANKLILSRYKTNQKVGKTFLVFVALIFACVAAIRDYNIGTDIKFYVLPVFNSALNNDFSTYWSINSNTIEPLYLLLNYFCSIISDEPRLLMGGLSFIISILVILRLSDYKENRKMWIGIFVYNFAFFPISLNLMRQSVAMAILFYSTRYIFAEKTKLRNFFIGTLLAMGFHFTGVIGLFLLLLQWYYKKDILKNELVSKGTTFKTMVMVVVLIIGVLLFDKVIAIIVPLSSFTQKYSLYYTSIGKNIDFNPLLVRLPFVIMIFLHRKEFYKKQSENYLLFMLMLTDMLTSLLRSYSSTLYRISIYFAYYKMISMPNYIATYYKNKKILMSVVICAMFYVIWIYQIVIQGNEQVFPYTANWLF